MKLELTAEAGARQITFERDAIAANLAAQKFVDEVTKLPPADRDRVLDRAKELNSIALTDCKDPKESFVKGAVPLQDYPHPRLDALKEPYWTGRDKDLTVTRAGAKSRSQEIINSFMAVDVMDRALYKEAQNETANILEVSRSHILSSIAGADNLAHVRLHHIKDGKSGSSAVTFDLYER